MIGIEYGHAGLLVSAFLAATILPLSSEAVLAALCLSGEYGLFPLWLSATVGNVGGSLVNWWLGRGCMRFRDRPWFPVDAATLEKAEGRYRRYGTWSLLLAWLPVVGDPLTLMGGLFRTPLILFIPLVTLGKGGRYLVLLYLLDPAN